MSVNEMEPKMENPANGGPPASVVEAAAASVTVRLISVVYMVYAQIQGLGILAGGNNRFSSDHTAYAIASSFPGGVISWGLTLFALGVVGLYGVSGRKRRTSFVAFTGMALWSFCFALCFARATAIYSTTSTTGMWGYGKDAAVFIVIAAIMHSNHYRKER